MPHPHCIFFRRPVVLTSILALAGLCSGAIAVAEPIVDGASSLGDKESGPAITFSSFKAHDDGSASIRVDVTKEVPVQRAQDGTTVTFKLVGAKIGRKNNKHPLHTEHFSSNVLKCKLDQKGNDAVLTITLRTKTPTTHRIITHGAGASLHIEVPPPEAPAPDKPS